MPANTSPFDTPQAVAFANNDYAHIAWSFGNQPLEGCAGFAVYRLPQDGSQEGTPMPAFKRDAEGNRLNLTCVDLPIKNYHWKDLHAQRGGTFRYRVVAMAGPGQPLPGVAPLVTGFVSLSAQMGTAQVYFNRGILATQRTSDIVWDPAHSKPDFQKITDEINDPDSELRKTLAGQHFGALTQLLDRATHEGGSCWASLYELTDGPLIRKLAACKNLHLILSNNNEAAPSSSEDQDEDSEDKGGKYDSGNQKAAVKLAGTAKELIRRYMPSGHIGHNKFIVYVNAQKVPIAVLTGSTNWTATGLCTQNNNAIIIENTELAQLYLDYWKELKKDAEAVGIPEDAAPMKGIQGTALRESCAGRRKSVPFDNGASIQAWFSPNYPHADPKRLKNGLPPPTPLDLAEVYSLIGGAQQSVLFLAFMPGKAAADNSFHFLQEVVRTFTQKPALFVRGAVSDPALTREFDMARLKTAPNEDVMIASPQGYFKNFESWRKEIYKFGHAIIHDKIIVIDPFSPTGCSVILGSHNLGFRASANNDENMLIIRGDQPLAQAYALHVMDVFEHYRSRWIASSTSSTAIDPEKEQDWQPRYFDPKKPSFAERLFWISNGAVIPQLADNPRLSAGLAAAEKAEQERQARAAAKKAAKTAGKKTATKKTAAKKTAAKKTAAKKTAAKKTAAKKTAAKKTAAKKTGG